MAERIMTAFEEREYHAANPKEKRPNKFAKDTIKRKNTDYYSYWRSVGAQVDYVIEEKKRLAREEELKKRKDKKKPVETEESV